MNCPKCHAGSAQVKDGFTAAGSQRYRCKQCGCRYTPQPRESGYVEEVRLEALVLHWEGLSLREIGRLLQVSHQSVANWVRNYAALMPPDLPPDILEIAEQDGVYIPSQRRQD